MKTLSILFFLTFQQMANPVLSPNFTINEEISEHTRQEIITSVSSVIEKYDGVGDFWNENENIFDEDKYLGFIELFAGDATVIDDLTFSKEALTYSSYAQLVFEKLGEIGAPFDLEKAEINKIDIDDSGFYVIDVTLVKRMKAAINQNGKAVRLKKGRKVKLNMRIDLPDYLLSDARIQYIKVQEARKLVEYVKQPINFISHKLQKR